MDKTDSEFSGLNGELKLAARQFERFERAQAEAAALAAQLSQSLERIGVAADIAQVERIGALAKSGRTTLDAIYPVAAAGFSAPALRECLMRMRMIADELRVSEAMSADVRLMEIFEALAAQQSIERNGASARPQTPVTEENLMRVRADMIAAREKALDAAKLMPMDALALRVQRLAAIAQDEGARCDDLVPLSQAWLAAPVLQTRLTRETGKSVRLEVISDGIYVERRLIPVLSDCVARLVTLAVTQLIETADARDAAAKPAEGLITIIAACDNDGLSLTIADDGAGDRAALSLEELEAHIAALGGGVQAVCTPNWGASVTLAIPATALGPWRLHVEPNSALGTPDLALAQ